MQVLVLGDDVPEPATHGGRLAIKNEIEALRNAGYSVRLVAFHRGRLSQAVVDANRGLVPDFDPEVDAVPRPSLMRSTLRRPWLPYQVSSRLFGHDAGRIVRGRRPELIIAHHDWTLPAAFELAEAAGGVAVVLRSHNDERRYYRDVAGHARGAAAAYLSSEYLRLRLFLARVSTDRVAEAWFMSAGDVAHPWSGAPHRVIPPVMFHEAEPLPEPPPVPAGQTIAFVGALDIPHTVAGLRWFLEQAWPLVRQAVPQACLLVAGRRPAGALSRQIEATPNARLVASPASLDGIFARTRVFINPVFAGSGVNLKLGQPLRRNIPTVTTTVGLRGLEGMRGVLSVADAAEPFARHCATLVSDDRAWCRAARAIAAAAGTYSAASVGRRLDEAIQHLVDHGR